MFRASDGSPDYETMIEVAVRDGVQEPSQSPTSAWPATPREWHRRVNNALASGLISKFSCQEHLGSSFRPTSALTSVMASCELPVDVGLESKTIQEHLFL